MASKEQERKSVDVILSKMPELKGFIDISDENQERPDFVFRKDNQVIGIEHIELPLQPMKKGQNTDHFFKGQTRKTYNTWKDDYQDNYEGAVQDIEDLINGRLKEYSKFTYAGFIENAAYLLGIVTKEDKKRKHNATEYLKKLKEKYPECDCKIVFVLDVGYVKTDLSRFQYRDFPEGKMVTQRRTEFPFTIHFFVILGFIRDVKDIYLVWHPYDEYEGKLVKYYGLHYDNNCLVTADNIRYMCCEFDMPRGLKKGSVKLNFQKEENQ